MEPVSSNNERVAIYHLEPETRGGRAYKLVYHVPVPLGVYWKFKTDFDNDFLLHHKYIREHRFISRTGNIVLTEDKYANAPDIFFRWQTKVFPKTHRLEFSLTNAKECGQKFHYGTIQVEATKDGTKVTQVAYFDFWGAHIWARYPWGGGMKDFLLYTARWEKKILLHLKNRYSGETGKGSLRPER